MPMVLVLSLIPMIPLVARSRRFALPKELTQAHFYKVLHFQRSPLREVSTNRDTRILKISFLDSIVHELLFLLFNKRTPPFYCFIILLCGLWDKWFIYN